MVAAVGFVISTLATNLVSFFLMPDLTAVLPQNNPGLSDQGDQSSIAKPTLSDEDLKLIYERNLFNKEGQLGDVDETGDGLEGSGNEAQKSDLPLRLTGIIYGGTPFNGLATVENTQNNTINSFIVGDTLVKDAQVSEIHRTRVYIERGKRREYLELQVTEIVRTTRQRKAQQSNASGGVAPIATGPALAKFKEEGFERDGTEMVMSQDYKQRMILGDLTKVLQDAKAVPNMVDNQIRGFRLERIRENSVYQKAGFQNGDVVEEINGVLLNDAGSAIKQLRMVQNESEVDVLVRRNGATINLKLRVQ